MTEKLTGAYIDIYKVADPDGTPVYTLLAVTKDDVDLAMNPEMREVTIHNESRKTKKATHDAPVLSLAGLAVSSLGALSTLGVQFTDGGDEKLRGFVPAGLEAVEFRVFENDGDVTPKTTMTCLDVQVMLNNLTYPTEDFAMWSGEVHVNGVIRRT